MATTDKKLCAGTLTASNATLYTAPSSAGAIAIVKSVTLCNTSASTATVTLKLAGVTIISTYSLTAYATLTLTLDQIINASELIEGSSDTTSVISYYISGKEVTA